MITYLQKGIYKPNPKYALTVLHSSLNEPRNLNEALRHPYLFDTIHKNNRPWQKKKKKTWDSIPRTPNMNGSRKLSQNMMGLLAGSRPVQLSKVIVNFQALILVRLFTHVSKPTTIHVTLSIAVTNQWFIHQLMLKMLFYMAFLKRLFSLNNLLVLQVKIFHTMFFVLIVLLRLKTSTPFSV